MKSSLKLLSFVSSVLTRPADTTAYASGDIVANNVTAGSVVIPTIAAVGVLKGGGFRIKRVKLKKSGAVLTNAAFRIHFYDAPPVPTNGDNGVWLTTEAGYLGSIDVTIDRAFAAGSVGLASAAANAEILGVLKNARFLYTVIEARGAYTPISGETFQVTTWADVENAA